MGLYPRKGALAVGLGRRYRAARPAPAQDRARRRSSTKLHEADYTSWEGRDLAAWPSLVMLRGKIVVENGAFKGDLKDGEFLSRKVPEEIRTRPAVYSTTPWADRGFRKWFRREA